MLYLKTYVIIREIKGDFMDIFKELFYYVDTTLFVSYDNNLYYRDQLKSERIRLAIFIDGFLFDIKTGEQILPIPEDNQGIIEGPIYENTLYIQKVIQFDRDITDEEKKLAEEIYNRYLTHKALIAEGKLLMYHKKRLY